MARLRLALLIPLLIGIVYGVLNARQPGLLQPALLRVHFIDVGQGDSILIEHPDGSRVLIDGGYDNGMALAYLRGLGIDHLDAVIASHPHADHIGGLIEVMQALPVNAVWTNGAIHTTGTFERFLDTIAMRQVPYFEAGTGDQIMAGGLVLDVLHVTSSAYDLNDTSLVLRLEYGNSAFLFTGDASQTVEGELLQTSVDRLPSTVLKIGHHGSYTASSSAFLQVVHPQIAVYSAGRGNSYGHPHSVTLQSVAAVGAAIYGTNVNGTIIVESDGVSVSVVDALPMSVMEITPMVVAPPLAATPGLTTPSVLNFDPFGPDRDCGNFRTHDEAQAFFVAAGGPERDPHRLDGDDDGIACESLP